MAPYIANTHPRPKRRRLRVATLACALFVLCSLVGPLGVAPAFAQDQDNNHEAGATLLARVEKNEHGARKPKRQREEPVGPTEAAALVSVDAEDQELVATVERGLQQADVDALLRSFRYFGGPEEDAQRQEAVRLFLQGVFDQFGPASSLGKAVQPREELGLGVVHSAEEAQWLTAGCEPRTYYFTTALGKVKNVGIRLIACRAPDKVWLKELKLVLGDPNAEARAKSDRFQNGLKTRYAALLEQTKAAGARQAQAPKPAPPAAQPAAFAASGAQAAPPPASSGTQVGAFAPSGFSGPFAEMFKAVGAVTTTVVSVVLSLALLVYMFFALCLFCIARKLDTPGAWLAWLPVANCVAMVASARRPFWWNAVLLSPLLVWLPIPGMGAAMWILGLASIALLALVWMHICVRLGAPAWVGLFILAPFANLFLPAFLAFKPERFAPQVFWKRTLLTTLIVYTCLVSIIWMLVSWGMKGALKDLETNMVKEFPMVSAPRTQSKPPPPSPMTATSAKQPPASSGVVVVEPAAPSLEKVSMPADLTSLTEAEYEALFKAAPPSFGAEAEARPKVKAGPANILFATFWPDHKVPHFWLKLRLPALPALQYFKSGALLIERVVNQTGQDVYDRDNPFETANFRDLNFNRSEGPPAYLEGLRDAHVKPGVREEDVKRIEGVATVLLPISIKAAPIGKNDLGAPVAIGGLRFTLRKIKGKQVELEVSGPIDRHVATLGVDAAGRSVERSQYSAWTESPTKKNYTYGFKSEVVELKVLVAEKIVEKRIPFVLAK